MTAMRELAPDIWLEERPLRFFGMPFGTRMTVIRLTDGTLFVHSPVGLTSDLRFALDGLGEVACVVSPNKLHHLYMGEWQEAYPRAKLYASPGLPKKRRDLKFEKVLGDSPEPVWADEIDQVAVKGSFMVEEIVFFHKASRTLILTDLMEHFCEDKPFYMRLLTRVAGMYGRPITPPDWRATFWRRSKTREALQRIIDWQAARIVLAHGRLIEGNVEQTLRTSFAWLKLPA